MVYRYGYHCFAHNHHFSLIVALFALYHENIVFGVAFAYLTLNLGSQHSYRSGSYYFDYIDLSADMTFGLI